MGEELALAAARGSADVIVANPGFLLGPGDVRQISTWSIRHHLQGGCASTRRVS